MYKFNANCYVLSGGKSQRMGKDKALLKRNNITFLEHLIFVYKPFFSQVFISSSNINHDIIDAVRISDKIENIGPIGGIYSALQHNLLPCIFISATDLPLVNQELVQKFLSKIDSNKINVVKLDSKVYPLFFYAPAKLLSELINYQISQQDFKLQNLFIKKYLNEIDMSKFANNFSNINSDKDFKNII